MVRYNKNPIHHYDDVIMGTIASQSTSLTTVYLTVCSGADQSKHQSSASLAFVWGIHRRPVNSPHKWPVTRKMFPFDDVIMNYLHIAWDRCIIAWTVGTVALNKFILWVFDITLVIVLSASWPELSTTILYIFRPMVQTWWVAKLADGPELLTGIFNWPQWKPNES